jgi:phosphoserine phosphatase RsbU/P
VIRIPFLRHGVPAAASPSGSATIRPPPLTGRQKYVVELCVVFGAYVVAGTVGLAVPFTSGNVSPIWPAAGTALAALLLLGYRVWPAIAGAAFVVNYFSPLSLPAALAIAAGNTAGPVVGAWLVRRLPGFRSSLNGLTDVLALIGIAVPASAALSATVGVAVLYVTHVDPWARSWPAWIVWWLGDATGALLIAPLALTARRRPRITRLRRTPELALLFSVTVITCFAIFDARPALGIEKDVFAFVALPLVLWGASRFEIPGAAGVTLLVASVAVWETANGFGPFTRNSRLQNAIMLQAFTALLSVWGLILAAAMAERSHLIRRQAHRHGREQNERRFRPIVETAHDGIWMLDSRLMTAFVSPRMAAMLGYTVQEMQRRPLSAFVSDTAWAEKQHLRQPGPPGGDHAQVEYRRKDGSRLWADVTLTRGFSDDGTFTGMLKMVSDMSTQRRTEGERQAALGRVALLSEAVEQTADSVLISDSMGRIEYVNPAFEGTTGFTRDEALGKTPRLLKSGYHGKDFYQDMWGRLLSGQPYRGTLVNRKKSGELYWANQTVTPIKDPYGTVTHFVAVLKDVTEIRKYHEQEVQLRLARAVQQRFSPLAPRVEGLDIGAASHPTTATGGDYFDFIEAPDGFIYVAIGDVSGHGFDAALIMALTRAYIRAFATLGMEVGDLLACVNQAILGDLEPERYVTMLLLRLDVEAASLTYANAGHLPGVLLDPSGTGGAEDILDSTGVPLGLFPDATFATRHCQFKTGQILVLGTDGATETANGDGKEFGRTGVLEYVRDHANQSAQDISTGVYRAARSFGASDEQHDDITSVIIKVTHVPVRLEQTLLPLEAVASAI